MYNIKVIENDLFLCHLTGYGHPESPQRFKIAKAALREKKFIDEHPLPLRLATDSELLLCHTGNYLDIVRKNIEECSRLGIRDGSFQLSTGDVQICPDSEIVARAAVGAVLEAVDDVMNVHSKSVFCLVRPPGHHACSHIGMGFCIYNNVAVAARYACKKYGIDKILIVDWDVHHGNGTQEIFYEDSTVFYFSTHNGLIYPGTGRASETGKGKGEGFTLNVPIDPRQNPREKVKLAFEHLADKMKSYQPQLIFISAGFDAHLWDPLGGFNLTTQDFVELTEIVKKMAQNYCEGRIVSVLEGGYNLDALAEVIPAHVQALESINTL